jgi:hypothetical protein
MTTVLAYGDAHGVRSRQPGSASSHAHNLKAEQTTLPALLPYPHGGVRPFYQKSTCHTQFTSGSEVKWVTQRSKVRANDALEFRRVVMGCGGAAGPTNFQFPCGVSVDLEGRLVVADTLNNRVQVRAFAQL